MSAPDGFILPDRGLSVGQQGIMKATGGAVGSQAVRFYQHRTFNAGASDRTNTEKYSDMVICGIKNDKYTEIALVVEGPDDRFDKNGTRVAMRSELSPKLQIETASIYERFKSQKDSTDTPIEHWDAIQPSEKLHLAIAGVMFVEQLASFQDAELFKLGAGGKDMRERALRHVNGKKMSKGEEFNQDMRALLEEKQKDSERVAALEERLLAMQAQLAEKSATKGKPGRPPKIQVQSAGIQP